MKRAVRTVQRALPLLLIAGTLTASGATGSGSDTGVDETTSDPSAIGPSDNIAPLLAEDFDGADLDRDRWGTCHWWAPEGGCTIASNDELEWYVDDAVSVDGGTLRLTAKPDPITVVEGTFPYRSGMVSTGPVSYEDEAARFSFTYGYVEARLKLPEGKGIWPAFWLLPADKESLPEIDILETLGDSPGTARLHYHWTDPGGDRQSIGQDVADRGPLSGWHRYGVDWRPGRITWTIDGDPAWSISGPSVSDEPMYVVLNLAVGGEWPGAPDDDTEFPATLEADWIRVWPLR